MNDLFDALFGPAILDGGYVAVYSARLDESGTDGRSRFMFVGGAIATADQWKKLEASWQNLLSRSKIEAFHSKDFNDPHNEIFSKWTRLKKERFVSAQEKIIRNNTMFRTVVGIERKVHSEIKTLMKGIRGYHPDSDYGLCLRWLMFMICEQLSSIDRDARLALMVEDGPWASGALNLYRRVAAMRGNPGNRRAAKHAHRLVGFSAAPKGVTRSLEAADYLVGVEGVRLLRLAGGPTRTGDTLSVLLGREELEIWYQGMLAEKDARRVHWQTTRAISTVAALQDDETPG